MLYLSAWALAAEPAGGCPAPPSDFGSRDRSPVSMEGKIYLLASGTRKLPDFSTLTSAGSLYTARWDIAPRAFTQGFPGITDRFEWFAVDYQGPIDIAHAGNYGFRLGSDDGAVLSIDGAVVINRDGLRSYSATAGKVELAEGPHEFRLSYFQGPRYGIGLQLWVTPPGEPEKIFNLQDFNKGLKDSRAVLAVTEDDNAIQVNLGAELLFDTGKYALRPSATQALKDLGVLTTGYPGLPIAIGGHTDSVGSDAANQRLSDNRARAVKDWLIAHTGLKAACVTTQGFGETRPIAGNDTAEGRQFNRRVEIKLQKRQTPAKNAVPVIVGRITRWDGAVNRIVAPNAKIERLTGGFTWSEGPLWIAGGGYLLFSDVPGNTMYRWSPAGGLSTFLKPSGYAGKDASGLREAGSNGLFADGPDAILLADSGNRSIVRLELSTRHRTTLAATYDGKRLNSPNDVIRSTTGVIFFTDPPYGLKDIDASPLKELSFNGVYRLDGAGKLTVVDADLSFPNGIALSPDETTLYVANSDPKRPIWMAYALNAAREVTGKRQFADASDLALTGAAGLPDGMKVGPDGTLFASAPGGILMMTPTGHRLGRIETGDAISNCGFGEDGKWLYMTSHSFIARVPLLKR